MSVLGDIWNAPDPLQGVVKAAANLHLPDVGLSTIAMGTKNLFGNTAQAAELPTQSSPSYNVSSGAWQGPIAVNPTSGTGNKSTSSSKTSSSKTSSGGGLTDSQKKLQSQIGDAYSSTISNYKNQINSLPGQQQDSMGQIDNLAQSQTKSVTDALNAALAKYDNYRGEVASNQKNTLQDLADNTRNLFQAGNNYLGTLGAGNSSATGMYSAALTQQANKQRGDVQNQTNKQYNDLNMSQQDTQNQYQQTVDQIGQWKATQQATIVSQYQDLKRQLESAYASAKDSQKGAIANLSMKLADQAQASLSNINNVASQYHNSILDSLNNQQRTTGDLVNGVQQNANNYTVGQIVTQDIAGMPNVQTDGQGNYLDQATGNLFQKKDDGTYQFVGNNGSNGF